MTHEELKDLLPLRALDRLEPDEDRAVTTHLAGGCPQCEGELASFREALGALALAADQHGGSRDRIWQLVEARVRASHASAGVRAGMRALDGAVPPVDRLRAVSFAALAIAALALCALAFNVLSVNRELERARGTAAFEVAALRARIDQLQRGLESASARIADLKSQLSLTSNLTLAAFSPDARMVHLAGLAAAPKASGTVAFSPGSHTAFMQVSGLPPAPADKIYEAWWIGRQAGPIRAGLFEAPAEGVAKVALIMPPRGEEIIASAVTLEPANGTDKPTGTMYLKGDMPPR